MTVIVSETFVIVILSRVKDAAILTASTPGSTLAIVEIDDEPPRGRTDTLAALAREDLDRLSVAELDDRIAVLRQEIVRTEAKLDFARDHKASADALFLKT